MGIAAAFAGLAPVVTGAADLTAAPSLTVRGERTSNLRNESVGTATEYVLRAIPAAEFALDTVSGSLKVSGGLEFEWYERSEEVRSDRVAQYAELATPVPLKLSQRFSVDPSIRYVESNDASRRNEVTSAPIEDLAPSETLVTERTTTRQYEGALQTSYLATPNTRIGLGGGIVRRDFPGGPPTLIGSRTLRADGSVAWNVKPVLWVGLYGDTTYNTFEQGPVSPTSKSRTYTGGLTGRYLLTEAYSVDVRGGATYVVNRTGIEDRSANQWCPYGRLSLTYASREFRTTLFGSYEVAGAGSAGRTTKRGTISLTLSDRFVEKWSWDLAGTYQTNRSIGDIVTDVTVNEDGTTVHVAAEDVVTASGSAGIRYDPFRWASIRLAGDILRQWSSGLVGGDLRRNSIALGVTLRDVYKLF